MAPNGSRPSASDLAPDCRSRWQGWAITIGFLAISTVLAFLFANRPLLFIAAVIPITATLLVITAKTTRGGWRWRWGEDD